MKTHQYILTSFSPFLCNCDRFERTAVHRSLSHRIGSPVCMLNGSASVLNFTPMMFVSARRTCLVLLVATPLATGLLSVTPSKVKKSVNKIMTKDNFI